MTLDADDDDDNGDDDDDGKDDDDDADSASLSSDDDDDDGDCSLDGSARSGYSPLDCGVLVGVYDDGTTRLASAAAVV